MSIWQLLDAQNQFDEVVRRATDEGPQTVTVHGEPVAVVVSAKTWARMTASRKSFSEYLLEGPPWPDDLVEMINHRSRDTGRDIEF